MNNKEEIKITIVILNYMKALRVVESVDYILQQKADFGFKVIVSDNSCDPKNEKLLKDGLERYGEEVELIINPANIGYTRAYNAVREKVEGDFVFIVNPDVLLKEDDSLKKMIDYMENNPDIGILGPKQINDSGEIAMTVRAFPRLYLQVARRTFLRNWPMLRNRVAYDEMQHLDYSKIQDVDWLQSSCVVIRRNLWEKIGGLSEKYFLFMSDVEICVKAWNEGYRVVYYPKTRVFADGKRLSAGGFMHFFRSWIMRQHVIDSVKYRLRYFWKSNPRKKYYKIKGVHNA